MFLDEKCLGRDFAGVIEEVGTNLQEKWSTGDKVCGMTIRVGGQGTISSRILVDPSSDVVMTVPESLSDEQEAA
jgi:NADPH:quinone reductase-like Zn-dependent oxidoreductase